MKSRIRMGWSVGLLSVLLTASAWAAPISILDPVSVSVEVPKAEAPLNNPAGAVNLVRRVVDALDPSYETVWAWNDGTWSQGLSCSIYNLRSNQIHLASVRLGYATGETLYAGVGLDLPGLAKRFVPETIKGYATVAPLDMIWSAIGKYARVMPIGGYNWNERKPQYGMTFGAAVTF